MSNTKQNNIAADHWNKWQDKYNKEQPKYTDWGDHPTILDLMYKHHFGSSNTTLFDHINKNYPEFSTQHALSLCSGDGSFEKLLLMSNVFGAITGMDIADTRVETANMQLGELAGRLDFILGDVNDGQFCEVKYDIVFAKAALHHIEQLETMFAGVKRCLKPGGKLVTLDFFGPTRFQWTDEQLFAVNHFLNKEIPYELLTKPDGSIYKDIGRPTIDQMIDMDPSEAVRSSDIYPLIQSEFTIIEEIPIGGTLLNLIFDQFVINRFDVNNSSHNQIIKAAFEYERQLIADAKINCDFKFIVAKV